MTITEGDDVRVLVACALGFAALFCAGCDVDDHVDGICGGARVEASQLCSSPGCETCNVRSEGLAVHIDDVDDDAPGITFVCVDDVDACPAGFVWQVAQ